MRFSVIGLGPAGAAIAYCAAQAGHEVHGYDPAPYDFPPTVGLWSHQLPDWLIAAAQKQNTEQPEHHLNDQRVQNSLSGDRGEDSQHARGKESRAGSQHTPDIQRAQEPATTENPLIVAQMRPWVMGDGWEELIADSYALLDPTRLSDLLSAPLHPASIHSHKATMADCAAAGAEVAVVTAPQGAPLPIRQLALGYVLPEHIVPPEHRRAVLMDLRALPGTGDPAHLGYPGYQEYPWASFSYRMPLGDGTWLIEETVVATVARAADDAAQWQFLEKAQDERLKMLGICPQEARRSATRVERVDFPLGPMKWPVAPHRWWAAGVRQLGPATVAGLLRGTTRAFRGRHGGRPRVRFWGAGAGTIHAATGYSVGYALTSSQREVACLAGSRATTWGLWRPPHGWITGWLHRRGVRAALEFSPRETRHFYRLFFQMPSHMQRDYLTGNHPWRVFRVMAWLLLALAFPRRGVAAKSQEPGVGRAGDAGPAGGADGVGAQRWPVASEPSGPAHMVAPAGASAAPSDCLSAEESKKAAWKLFSGSFKSVRYRSLKGTPTALEGPEPDR